MGTCHSLFQYLRGQCAVTRPICPQVNVKLTNQHGCYIHRYYSRHAICTGICNRIVFKVSRTYPERADQLKKPRGVSYSFCILYATQLCVWFLKLVRTPLNVYFTAFKSSFFSLYAHINSDECHA